MWGLQGIIAVAKDVCLDFLYFIRDGEAECFCAHACILSLSLSLSLPPPLSLSLCFPLYILFFVFLILASCHIYKSCRLKAKSLSQGVNVV